MIRPFIAKTIALKELLEALRDRKTLFMMIGLPILLYPGLLLIVSQVAMIQANKLADQESVIAYLSPDGPRHPFIKHLRGVDGVGIRHLEAADGVEPGEGGVDLVLDLSSWRADDDRVTTYHLAASYQSIVESSNQAAERLEDAVASWNEAEVARRLTRREVPLEVVQPTAFMLADNSPAQARGGHALGSFLPMLVIATVLIGAFYPAIDLTAGEKERGSIQTLFTAPITSLEIVVGKYLAVLAMALTSGMANLLAMGLVFSQNLMMSDDLVENIDFGMSFGVIAQMFVAIVLIALFFSALLLTVAVLGKSYKEAQNYVTPVYLLCFLPAIIAQLPGIELNASLAFIPAVNVTLLMKEVLVGGVTAESFFTVVLSTLIFTGLILTVAAKIFAQEEIIVGERGNLRLLARRRGPRTEWRPSIGEALAFFALVFVLFFYVGTYIQRQLGIWGIGLSLVALVLLPALATTRVLGLDFRETFNLRRPSSKAVLAAVLLGISVWIVVLPINIWLEQHVLRPPEGWADDFPFPDLGTVSGWVQMLVVFAIAPAICEEAMFRGFIFSSLRGRVSGLTTVVVSAILFGALHMSIYRFFGTTTLGIVMGLLVLRSHSIWTGAIFHGLNNAVVLIVAILYLDNLDSDYPPLRLFAAGALMTTAGLILLRNVRPSQSADAPVSAKNSASSSPISGPRSS